MKTLRLLADDLTGALDTAAEFVPVTGSIPVFWTDPHPTGQGGSAAYDSGTRECETEAAVAKLAALAPLLPGADIAFKKIDSLLRGQTLSEIAACMRLGFWRSCALAPAFPYQGRVTRAGRQYANGQGGWTAVSDDLVAALRARGVAAHSGDLNANLPDGVSLFDAETDADLIRIVTHVRQCAEPVLWAGTGGLAMALAADHPHPAPVPLPSPILGLFGSDHPATAQQLAECTPFWQRIDHHSTDNLTSTMAANGLALVSFDLPNGSSRPEAAQWIAARLRRLIHEIGTPGTVVVAGGETLRSLCEATGATRLDVLGRLRPGIPRSVMVGGCWAGATVISKSGAFGHRLLLRELLIEGT